MKHTWCFIFLMYCWSTFEPSQRLLDGPVAVITPQSHWARRFLIPWVFSQKDLETLDHSLDEADQSAKAPGLNRQSSIYKDMSPWGKAGKKITVSNQMAIKLFSSECSSHIHGEFVNSLVHFEAWQAVTQRLRWQIPVSFCCEKVEMEDALMQSWIWHVQLMRRIKRAVRDPVWVSSYLSF